jgi:hypothetical protein
MNLSNNKLFADIKLLIDSSKQQLALQYGNGRSNKHLRHCLRFAENFPDIQIVSALQRQSCRVKLSFVQRGQEKPNKIHCDLFCRKSEYKFLHPENKTTNHYSGITENALVAQNISHQCLSSSANAR